jgi:hypothetical protein
MLVGAASINAAGHDSLFAGFRAEGAAIFAGGIGALPSINDRDIAVFWGMRSATDQGIFTGKGGPLDDAAVSDQLHGLFQQETPSFGAYISLNSATKRS